MLRTTELYARRKKEKARSTFYWCPTCRRAYEEYWHNTKKRMVVEFYDMGGVAGDKTKICPECRRREKIAREV